MPHIWSFKDLFFSSFVAFLKVETFRKTFFFFERKIMVNIFFLSSITLEQTSLFRPSISLFVICANNSSVQ